MKVRMKTKNVLRFTILNVNKCHFITILQHLHLLFLFHFTGFDAVPKLEKNSDSDDANAQLEAGLGVPSNGSDEEKSKDDGMLGSSNKANSVSDEPGEATTAMDPAVAMGADFVPLENV